MRSTLISQSNSRRTRMQGHARRGARRSAGEPASSNIAAAKPATIASRESRLDQQAAVRHRGSRAAAPGGGDHRLGQCHRLEHDRAAALEQARQDQRIGLHAVGPRTRPAAASRRNGWLPAARGRAASRAHIASASSRARSLPSPRIQRRMRTFVRACAKALHAPGRPPSSRPAGPCRRRWSTASAALLRRSLGRPPQAQVDAVLHELDDLGGQARRQRPRGCGGSPRSMSRRDACPGISRLSAVALARPTVYRTRSAIPRWRRNAGG